ncbi:hypothetical protein [Defluviimonas salinarum]|uniref:Uncharacterized protein n=1 Tax=Defluviimonas salinarum TaxID=2992147 RepID=A0ABT3J883_9RHOB|nr:hypothetical protein [Defluviimonas salinarum]MCW3783898.1 hypothetical protein [Defluviimonas salinarum]
MAHHKRKKSRVNSGDTRVSREKRARFEKRRSSRYGLGNPPAWYNLVNFKRRLRREVEHLCHLAVLHDDPDAIVWPVECRQSARYW